MVHDDDARGAPIMPSRRAPARAAPPTCTQLLRPRDFHHAAIIYLHRRARAFYCLRVRLRGGCSRVERVPLSLSCIVFRYRK